MLLTIAIAIIVAGDAQAHVEAHACTATAATAACVVVVVVSDDVCQGTAAAHGRQGRHVVREQRPLCVGLWGRKKKKVEGMV